MPKIDEATKAYEYREDGATGYGNKKPSPAPADQAAEGELPAGWERYEYIQPSDTGFGKGSK